MRHHTHLGEPFPVLFPPFCFGGEVQQRFVDRDMYIRRQVRMHASMRKHTHASARFYMHP